MGGILNWAFRDVFLLIILVLILIVNPPEDDESEKLEISAQGQLIFTISWETGVDADVDLWVQPPEDQYISYLRIGGKSCNLLRDDVGTVKDKESEWYDPSNQEITVCRNPIVDREWIANIHYFGAQDIDDGKYVPVRVTWQLAMHDGTSIRRKDGGTVMLHKKGDEATLVRFKIAEDGSVYAINYAYKTLLTVTAKANAARGPF